MTGALKQPDGSSGSGRLLEVADVSVRFGGIVALDGVSFGVEAGQIAGLIGPNGAGKTTLFNCLSRLYECNSGSVSFDGHALLQMPRHRIAALGIGRTFQNVALFARMSVLDNVMVGRHCRTSSGFFANALRLPGVAAEQQRTAERARDCRLALPDAKARRAGAGARQRAEAAPARRTGRRPQPRGGRCARPPDP
jgi:branched-chain amino acid transport system ATP-binding protein